MRLRIRFAVTLLLVFFLCKVGMGARDDNKSEPYNYFRDYVGLNDEQIQSISNGKALAKILDTRSAESDPRFWRCAHRFDAGEISQIRIRHRRYAKSPQLPRKSENSAILPCFPIWTDLRSKRKT